MAFERYENQGRKYRFHRDMSNIPPVFSVQKTGYGCFNVAAAKKFNLYNYKFVTLFYERDTQTLGLKFTKSKGSKIQKKISINSSKNVCISLRGLLKYYNIDFPTTKKFPFTYDESKKMFLVQLGE